jgi:hypothetical protein
MDRKSRVVNTEAGGTNRVHIRVMMDAVRTSETSVDNYCTRQYIPEDNSELHTRLLENLKSHCVVETCSVVRFPSQSRVLSEHIFAGTYIYHTYKGTLAVLRAEHRYTLNEKQLMWLICRLFPGIGIFIKKSR